MLALRTCNRCRIPKSETEFYSRSDRPQETVTICISCCRLRAKQYRDNNPEKMLAEVLRKKYGISIADRQRLFDDQKGGCAICLRPLDKNFGRKVHVDHDHATGRVRGLLCPNCNAALGKFRESIEALQRAIAYLGNGTTTPEN